MSRSKSSGTWRAAMIALGVITVAASAQTPSPNPTPEGKSPPAAEGAPAAPQASPLDQFAWLRGCWAGKVERREFIETWLPPRGGMMVGISHTVVQERRDKTVHKTQDYTYLRIEARADGVYYVAIPSGQKETAFKLTSVAEKMGRPAVTFANPVDEFPNEIVYMRGKEGWLYAQVAGKVKDHPKNVTYPMQHVDCATGALKED
jgi:hypothetical protein